MCFYEPNQRSGKLKNVKYSEIDFWEDLKSGKFANMVRESVKGQAISNSQELYNILRPLYADQNDVEACYAVFLNGANFIVAIEKIFSGSLMLCTIHPREILKKIFEYKSAAVIMSHNHPSGKIKPSKEDLMITKRIHIAMQSIEAKLLDHIIVGDGYFSMADEGIIKSIKEECNDLFIKIP